MESGALSVQGGIYGCDIRTLSVLMSHAQTAGDSDSQADYRSDFCGETNGLNPRMVLIMGCPLGVRLSVYMSGR